MKNINLVLLNSLQSYIRNIEHYLIEGTKIAKILNVFTKYKKVSPLYFQKIDEETKKCAVVDPGGASDKILTYLKKNSLELEYILLTHGHGDHIGAVNYIKSKTNATIVAHSDEKELLNDNRKNLSYSMHCGPQELNADVYVNDKDKLELGNLKLSFIHTPGHTKGSICKELMTICLQETLCLQEV